MKAMEAASRSPVLDIFKKDLYGRLQILRFLNKQDLLPTLAPQPRGS